MQEIDNASWKSSERDLQGDEKKPPRTSTLQQDWRVTFQPGARREHMKKTCN